MQTQVDLKQLAIDRGSAAQSPRSDGHWLSRYLIPIALLVASAAILGWSAWDLIFPPTEVTVVPVQLTRATAEPAGTKLFESSGWIEPRPTPIHVPALAEGVIKELLVVDDQELKAGDPVAKLINNDAQLALASAEADLRLRKAELDNAEAGYAAALTRFEQPVHLEAPLRQAEAELAKIATQLKNLPYEIRQAEAQREFAQRNYDGKEAARGAVVGRLIEKAEADLASAIAVVEALRERKTSWEAEHAALVKRRDALRALLDMLVDEIAARDQAAAQVKAAEARVCQAEVAVDESQLRLDRMTVYAPVDGRVYHLKGHLGAQVGGTTNSGGHASNSVITMYRPDRLQVRVDVRFDDVPKVKLGQEVLINNASISKPISGHVLYISSEADIQKNTLEVKVALSDVPEYFKPEMLVDASFLAMESSATQELSEEERIYVPRNLVQDRGGESPFVWLADQSEARARKIPIKLGTETPDGMVEVQSGLNRASRILATGFEGLEDGDRIRVIGDEPPESTDVSLRRMSKTGSPATSL
ncbi:MAG: HlyD family efflux transporter periplasmic adaptor subunit [Pirellulales bacterium]|nr:HlyD family efflux transporter periplasmic adaptor subunit [Pirellulales bacterium]